MVRCGGGEAEGPETAADMSATALRIRSIESDCDEI